MWLRDSANQLQSYVSLLKPASRDAATGNPTPPAPSKLASIFRGAINLQARYILASPYCNAFQPPMEAEMPPGNDGNPHDIVFPAYNPSVVFECKYELDSLAAFLQLSWDYFYRTKDARFFVEASSAGFFASHGSSIARKKAAKGGGRRRKGRGGGKGPSGATDGWKDAVEAILHVAEQMRQPTYREDGMVPDSPYRFERFSAAATETLPNRGNGSPVRAGTGLVRSAFRPSDDATTYQFLVPANMMLAHYLELCAEIMAKVEKEEERVAAQMAASAAAAARAGTGRQQEVLSGEDDEEEEDEEEEGNWEEEGADAETVTERMRRMAKEIKKGIEKYGKVKHPDFGEMYAYEVDGYHSTNMMVSFRTRLKSPVAHSLKDTPGTDQPMLSFRTMPTSPPSSPPH